MRKRLIQPDTHAASPAADQIWLDLEQLARVELTSEDAKHPIESALQSNPGVGWRADQPGKQTIRFLFDQPQKISRIQLLFEEHVLERTQEFTLHWSADDGASWRELVRQQYNFSPPDSTRELEDYAVNLDGVTTLELDVVPSINGGQACATLAQLRLAG
jgi:hypothetical protein